MLHSEAHLRRCIFVELDVEFLTLMAFSESVSFREHLLPDWYG